MSHTLHERLVGLVTQIYSEEQEAFRLDPQKGKMWKGAPPLFSAPIALHHVVYEVGSCPEDPLLKVADLEYDDTKLRIGKIARDAIPDSDPIGHYILEGITEIYARHDHDICLEGFARLHAAATPLYTGYQEKQDRMVIAGPRSIHDTSQ